MISQSQLSIHLYSCTGHKSGNIFFGDPLIISLCVSTTRIPLNAPLPISVMFSMGLLSHIFPSSCQSNAQAKLRALRIFDRCAVSFSLLLGGLFSKKLIY